MIIYDSDIRIELYKKIVKQKEFYSDLTTKLIDEMGIVGSSRIDVAVINGKLHGYEIKSERDSLERLPSQIETYNKVFDKMTIICSEKYSHKILNLVPEWWAVLEVKKNKKNFKLKSIRDGKINPCIDILLLINLLWKDEMINFLETNEIKGDQTSIQRKK